MTLYKMILLTFGITIISGAGLFAANTPTVGKKNTTNAIQRYALYVASSQGGPGSDTLRYTGSDAEKLSETMTEIGGIKKQNSYILINPTKEEINDTFKRITTRIRESSTDAKRVEFLFYYSGHSDENALLLGNETYGYSNLKAAISAVTSDIHVVILDSCFSGNFIRAKGGSRRKPFLLDDSTVVQGHAYLSSSSENESSQESDTIGASYFTSSVITGLRGAADTSGDNKVSLNELYDYAFNNTLSETELSTIGPQHPSYNITLVGSGDLVLTDISEADSVLILPKQSNGRFIVRTDNGKLVSEVNKTAGNKMELALPAGTYTVTLIGTTATKQATIRLDEGISYTLEPEGLHMVPLSSGTARGPAAESEENIQFTPFCIGLAIGSQYPLDAKNTNIAFGLFTNSQDRIRGIQVTLLYGNIKKDLNGVQVSGFVNTLNGNGQGVQGSGFMNIASGDIKGVQGSGFLNIADGDLQGVQGAGFLNVLKGNGLGVQSSGFMNVTNKDFTGVQGTGFLNILKGNGRGIQGSGFLNITNKDFTGIQGTGFLNIVRGNGHGIQGAGFMNVVSGDIKGTQVAGLLNITRKIDGTQIGIVNVAKENNGIAVGLLNIIGNGIMSPAVYFEHDQIFVQYQSGTNTLFTTLLFGCPFDRDYAVSGAGFGTRIGKKAFKVDLELLYKQIIDPDLDIDSDLWQDNVYPSARISANFMFKKHLGLFIAYNADFEASGWNEHAFTYWDHGVSHHFDVGNTNCTLYSYGSIGIKF